MDADLIIIGGGITGLGVARDAAMRGLSVILLERNELGSGTSGHFHEILHSGARYAVVDPDSARECHSENQILRRIAKEAILDTGGLFLAFSEEEVRFADTLIEACKFTHIPTQEVSPTEIHRKEPRINKTLRRAFTVPAAHIKGTKTLEMNRVAAEKMGAQIITDCEVIGFIKNGGKIEEVKTRNNNGGERTFKGRFFINTSGVWAGKVGEMAGVKVSIKGYKGSLIAFSEHFTSTYLNRCRMPADGDLLMPTEKEYIIGTTSVKTDDIDTHKVEQWEIDKLIKEAATMVPDILNAPIARAYAGVRPIYSPSSEQVPDRTESRSFKILGHKKEGVENLISVVGGKFMIYRLMAEKAVDEVSKELGITKTCQTATIPLQ